ncbi:MAG: murein biosynthesis integral membrane protein MurJ, partial [Candidatus Saccharimonadales bacterium]
FYNVSIIASIYLFKGNIGIVGLGIGALAGALLQLSIVLLGMPRLRYHWHPKILWKSADFRLILRQLPPRSMDQGIDQLESIVETHFARALGTGFISYYNNAYIMSTAPIFLIGTAISTAAFPRLNMRLSQGRPDLFRSDFLRILRAMIWIALPVIIISYFTRGYLARLIYSRNSPEIALIFGFLAGSIFFGILYTIISRWFYAQKDTKTPLFVSIFAIVLDVILVSILARSSTYGIAGLALTQSIVSMAEVLILLGIMLIRDSRLFDRQFWGGCARILSVSGFSLMTGYVMISFLPLGVNDRGFITLGGKVFLIAAVVILTHLAISYLFGLEEVQPLFNRLKKVITKPVQIEL